MLKERSSTKRLLSLIMSLVFLLSVTLLFPPAVFAVEDPPMEYFVANEAQFRTSYAAAAAIDRIFLNNDITLTEDLSFSKNIPINCGSYTITVRSTVTFSSGSIAANTNQLIIEDGGELRVLPGATIYGGEANAIVVNSGGSLLMSGGSIATGENGILINGGEATITGGTITIEMSSSSGVTVNDGSLQMSGGTIQSSDDDNSDGVRIISGDAIFTGGNIETDHGVVVIGGEVTISVPAQQLGGIYGTWVYDPMLTTSPSAITMQRGQTRTVTLEDADASFELYGFNTSPELNAEDAGARSATIRPLQAGSYTLSFHGMVGVEEAFITLNIPVTVTNPTSNNPGTPSGQGDDTPSSQSAQTPSVPSIPETGAGNLLQLLLLSVLCI